MKIFVAAAVASIVLSPMSDAGASEWGCKVLLCSASDNPSWQGVATCRPPMERLISAMRRPHFSWPTCPEGGAGKPGFERYAECPSGWAPATAPTGGEFGTNELSQCSRTIKSCGRRSEGFGQITTERRDAMTVTDDGCEVRVYTARPLREKPYYFDIQSSTGGSAERHYFSLDR